MDSGVAKRPLADVRAYAESLDRFVHRSGFIMKPVFTAAKQDPRRVVYAEGEDERVLRAVQAIVEEGLAKPILIGRPNVIETRLKRFGLAIQPGRDFELINPDDDPRYRTYVQTYIDLAGRRGITPDGARTLVRTNNAVIGALAAAPRRGRRADLRPGGPLREQAQGDPRHHRARAGCRDFAALSLIVTSKGAYFLADTHVRPDPSAEEIADVAIACGDTARRFGLSPKIALVSHADFGSFDTASSRKMRQALALVRERAPTSRSTARWRPTPPCRRRSATRCCRARASRARPTC